jgi:hypothetical protein
MYSYLHLISMTNALAAWGMVYWLIRPRLMAWGRDGHLKALIAPHLFRYLGLIALIPVLFDMRSLGFGDGYHAIVGYGDFASGLLALLSLVLLQRRSAFATPVIWLFNIVGLADFMHAGLQLAPAITDPAIIGPLGWPVFTVYLPMLIVSHLAIFDVLLRDSQNDLIPNLGANQ